MAIAMGHSVRTVLSKRCSHANKEPPYSGGGGGDSDPAVKTELNYSAHSEQVINLCFKMSIKNKLSNCNCFPANHVFFMSSTLL